MMGKPYKTTAPCPNCGAPEGIEIMRFPQHIGHATSRISAKSTTKFYNVPEKSELVSGCSNCGKSLEELKRLEKMGSISHESRLKHLKESNLPTVIDEPYDRVDDD